MHTLRSARSNRMARFLTTGLVTGAALLLLVLLLGAASNAPPAQANVSQFLSADAAGKASLPLDQAIPRGQPAAMGMLSLASQAAAIDSSGTFTDSGQSLGMARSFDVALGDLDGDGDLDAFVANSIHESFENPANLVWLNDGAGLFSDSGQRLGDGYSFGVALGDLDADGDLDAFVANSRSLNAAANKVWLNDGAGLFSDSGQRLGDSLSYDVALGDVDGDDDLDAFVANAGANWVWLNDGVGVFSDSGQRLGDSSSLSVSLDDIDGDGDLDACTANGGQGNRIWLNSGKGVFGDSDQSLSTASSRSMDLGDLDNDGDLDAFIANGVGIGEANEVWLNDGQGVFSDSGQRLGDAPSHDVTLGDVDGDGDLDAFVANYSNPNPFDPANTVWLNDGQGAFSDSGQRLGISLSEAAALGDLDGDGDLDAFVANYFFMPNTVWLNLSPASCPAEVALAGPGGATSLQLLRQFRDEVLATSPATRRYIERYYRHAPEVARILLFNAELRTRTAQTLKRLQPILQAPLGDAGAQRAVLDQRALAAAAELLDDLSGRSSPDLRRTLAEVQSLLAHFEGRPAGEAWELILAP